MEIVDWQELLPQAFIGGLPGSTTRERRPV